MQTNTLQPPPATMLYVYNEATGMFDHPRLPKKAVKQITQRPVIQPTKFDFVAPDSSDSDIERRWLRAKKLRAKKIFDVILSHYEITYAQFLYRQQERKYQNYFKHIICFLDYGLRLKLKEISYICKCNNEQIHFALYRDWRLGTLPKMTYEEFKYYQLMKYSLMNLDDFFNDENN